MGAFFSEVQTLWNQILSVISSIGPVDFLDIAFVAFIIYKGIQLVRETRAQQLLKGFGVLLVAFLMAKWINMITLSWLLEELFKYAIIAIVIIFQPEIRRALEQVGRSNFSSLSRGDGEIRESIAQSIDAICKASLSMQEQKIGALMVYERSTQLGEIAKTGTVLDSEASAALIGNVFFPKSPLHDGGMILRLGRIHAAGCILPLTANTELSRELGTRHRAAIGMSENSDALVVVVSEETGKISVALGGVLTRNYTGLTLRAALESYLLEEKKVSAPRRFLRRIRPKGGNRNG